MCGEQNREFESYLVRHPVLPFLSLEFFRPTATVSTFPSDSEVALTAALHAAPVPGYEHRYFDRPRNTMRGGAWVTLSGYGIPYIQKLDYDPPGWSKAAPM